MKFEGDNAMGSEKMEKDGARNSKINWGDKIHQPLNDEITIKIKPKQLIKSVLVIVLFVAIFYMGRVSTESASCGLDDVSGFFKSFGDGDSATAAVVQDSEEVVDAEAELAAELVEGVVEDVPAEEVAAEENLTEETSEEDEVVITSYGNVALAVEEWYKEWYEEASWGRLNGLSFTIKNNEAGTIKPEFFRMTMEGDDDRETEFEVPYTSQSIKAGQSFSDEAAISGGFAYNPRTAGDLSNVKISLFLYDGSGKMIAYTVQDYNLAEEE